MKHSCRCSSWNARRATQLQNSQGGFNSFVLKRKPLNTVVVLKHVDLSIFVAVFAVVADRRRTKEGRNEGRRSSFHTLRCCRPYHGVSSSPLSTPSSSFFAVVVVVLIIVHISGFEGKTTLHPRRRHLPIAMLIFGHLDNPVLIMVFSVLV